MVKENATSKNKSLLRVLPAGLAGCVFSILLVVLFAFVLQKKWLPFTAMTYINLGIKLASALFSGILAAVSADSRAPLWGALASGIYMAATYVLFSLFSGGFTAGWGNLTDLLMCLLAGLIAGIAVNAVKK
jgi:putative membrane protein (TIGR04086 family)